MDERNKVERQRLERLFDDLIEEIMVCFHDRYHCPMITFMAIESIGDLYPNYIVID